MTDLNHKALTVLASYQPTYMPADKSVQPVANTSIEISDSTKATLAHYHELVDMLVAGELWIENREHTDNRFHVYDGNYLLTASSAYHSRNIITTSTVNLELDPTTLTPTTMNITICSTTMPEHLEPHKVYLPLSIFDEKEIFEVADAISKIVVDTIERLEGGMASEFNKSLAEVAQEHLDMSNSTYNLERFKKDILKTQLVVADEGTAEVVGYSLESVTPSIFVGFKINGEPAIASISGHHYLFTLADYEYAYYISTLNETAY